MKDLMLDLETFGTNDNPVIRSISAVQFDLKTGELGKEFHMNIKTQPQIDLGYTMCPETIAWWDEQSFEANHLVTIDQVEPYIVSSAFNSFLMCNFEPKSRGNVHDLNLWGNGIISDNLWLRNFYKHFNGVGAFSGNLIAEWWQDRCMRTIMSLVDGKLLKEETPFVGIPHYGIDDCKHQIKLLHKAMLKLGK